MMTVPLALYDRSQCVSIDSFRPGYLRSGRIRCSHQDSDPAHRRQSRRPPARVQERLGHADASITMKICSHAAPPRHDQAADQIASLFLK